ncbi:MAG: AroM family protein [Negativicutes bacterium]|nr:AroM family protein [Negativicutes bacterium]
MPKIGLITVGQSPRSDITPELLPLLPPDCQILERGALDGLNVRQIQELAPADGQPLLISRLRDGRSVTISRDLTLNRLQSCVDWLLERGANCLVLLCTGDLPKLNAAVPFLAAEPLLYRLVEGITASNQLPFGVLTPLESQIAQVRRQWRQIGLTPVLAAANPYDKSSDFAGAAKELQAAGARLILLDCLGFGRAEKRIVQQATHLPVILPRTVIGRTLAELLTTL